MEIPLTSARSYLKQLETEALQYIKGGLPLEALDMYSAGFPSAEAKPAAKLRSKERVLTAGLAAAQTAIDEGDTDLGLQTLLALEQLKEPSLFEISFQIYSMIALVLTPLGQLQGAKLSLEKALEICTANPQAHLDKAKVTSNLCAVNSKLGNHKLAAQLGEKAVYYTQEQMVNLGLEHYASKVPMLAVVLRNLAVEYEHLKKTAKALGLYEQAIKHLERYPSTDTADLLAELIERRSKVERRRKHKGRKADARLNTLGSSESSAPKSIPSDPPRIPTDYDSSLERELSKRVRARDHSTYDMEELQRENAASLIQNYWRKLKGHKVMQTTLSDIDQRSEAVTRPKSRLHGDYVEGNSVSSVSDDEKLRCKNLLCSVMKPCGAKECLVSANIFQNTPTIHEVPYISPIEMPGDSSQSSVSFNSAKGIQIKPPSLVQGQDKSAVFSIMAKGTGFSAHDVTPGFSAKMEPSVFSVKEQSSVSSDSLQKSAATLIQACFRGNQARRETRLLKSKKEICYRCIKKLLPVRFVFITIFQQPNSLKVCVEEDGGLKWTVFVEASHPHYNSPAKLVDLIAVDGRGEITLEKYEPLAPGVAGSKASVIQDSRKKLKFKRPLSPSVVLREACKLLLMRRPSQAVPVVNLMRKNKLLGGCDAVIDVLWTPLKRLFLVKAVIGKVSASVEARLLPAFKNETDAIRYANQVLMPSLRLEDGQLVIREAEFEPSDLKANESPVKLKLLKKSKDLIQGHLFARAVRELNGEPYTINIYKEKQGTALSLRFEVYSDRQGKKLNACVHTAGEVCEFLDLWDPSDLDKHKDRVFDIVRVAQGSAYLAKSQPYEAKELVVTDDVTIDQLQFRVTVHKANTTYFIKAEPLRHSLELPELRLSADELCHAIEAEDYGELRGRMLEVIERLCIEDGELAVQKRLSPVLISEAKSDFSSSVFFPRAESFEIEPTANFSEETKEVEKEDPVALARELHRLQAASTLIQTWFRRSKAHEHFNLLKLKHSRDFRQLVFRGGKLLSSGLHMVSVFKSVSSYLVVAVNVQTGKEYHKHVVDFKKYVFGYAASNSLALLLDAIYVEDGLVFFKKAVVSDSKVDVGEVDRSFFVEINADKNGAVVALQKNFRRFLASKVRRQLEGNQENKLTFWKILKIGRQEMAAGVYEAPGAFLVRIFPVTKSVEPYRVYERRFTEQEMNWTASEVLDNVYIQDFEIMQRPRTQSLGTELKLSLDVIEEMAEAGIKKKLSYRELFPGRILTQDSLVEDTRSLEITAKVKRGTASDRLYNDDDLIILELKQGRLIRTQTIDLKTASLKIGLPKQEIKNISEILASQMLQQALEEEAYHKRKAKIIQAACKGYLNRKLIKGLRDAKSRRTRFFEKPPPIMTAAVTLGGFLFKVLVYDVEAQIRLEATSAKDRLTLVIDKAVIRTGATPLHEALEHNVLPNLRLIEINGSKLLQLQREYSVVKSNPDFKPSSVETQTMLPSIHPSTHAKPPKKRPQSGKKPPLMKSSRQPPKPPTEAVQSNFKGHRSASEVFPSKALIRPFSPFNTKKVAMNSQSFVYSEHFVALETAKSTTHLKRPSALNTPLRANSSMRTDLHLAPPKPTLKRRPASAGVKQPVNAGGVFFI
jgi:tetratricopeptide (TPR) repeat protein